MTRGSMQQFEQTTAAMPLTKRNEAIDYRHNIENYALIPAREVAMYWAGLGFGVSFWFAAWFFYDIRPYYSLFFGVIGFPSFFASFGGLTYCYIRLSKYTPQLVVNETKYQPKEQPKPVIVQGDDTTVSLATMAGDVIQFGVPSYQTWLSFLRRAMSDQTSDKDSLGRNDAVRAGFTQQQWEAMFTQFLDHGLVQEHKGKKPTITATGAAVFGRHLGKVTPPTPKD